MQLIETETGPQQVAGRSRGSSSPARRGAGPEQAPVASRSFAARLGALRGNVWAPILGKALGLLAGMLALAAVGASSLARGSGVTVPAASGRPGGVAVAQLGAPAGAHPSEPSAGAPRAEVDAGAGDAGAPSAALTADGKVILNLADASELQKLPGVGPKRAEAIVLLRTKLGGRFKRVTDLLRVKGIGPKGLKKIEACVVLDAPKA